MRSYRDLQLGAFIDDQGIFVGYLPKLNQRSATSLVQGWPLFAATKDLEGPDGALEINFGLAEQLVTGFRDCGHTGRRYMHAELLADDIEHGFHEGHWFISTVRMVKELLLPNAQHLFRNSGRPLGKFYGTNELRPDRPHIVSAVCFQPRSSMAREGDVISVDQAANRINWRLCRVGTLGM